MEITPELIEILNELEKTSPMKMRRVRTQEEYYLVVSEMKEKGFRLAARSNTGTSEGEWRLTFLLNSAFDDTPKESASFRTNVGNFAMINNPHFQVLMDGLSRKVVVALDYGDDDVRFVEVHACGMNAAGEPLVRVYQISGPSQSDQKEGWKLMKVDKVKQARTMPGRISQAPRPGYKMGDSAMKLIVMELINE